MASLRTLKLRAWLKQLTGIYHESTAQHVAFVELSLVAASSLGYTPEQLRAWGML